MRDRRRSGDGAGRGRDRRRAEAARIPGLRFGGRRDAGERPARAPARRGQAQEPRGQARGRAARAGRSASATPAGRRTASRPKTNAHPHAARGLAVVHNGIIENFKALREELAAKGYGFATETDSEIAALVVEDEIATGKAPAEAVFAALKRMRGAFALVYLFEGHDDLLIGARQGAPLAIGYGEGEMYLGSDALALAPFTDRVAYLEEGDWVVVTRARARRSATPPASRCSGASSAAPPAACSPRRATTATSWPRRSTSSPRSSATRSPTTSTWPRCGSSPSPGRSTRRRSRRVTIIGCGTAYMAGLVGKYWIERFARLPVEIDVASEYRYREAPVDPNGLTIVISQSGETADTLASLQIRQGARLEDDRRRQRAGFEHRPPDRRRRADAGRARRSASPRPRRSPASSRRWRRSPSASAARAGRSTRRREAALLAELVATPGLHRRGAEARAGGREARAGDRPRPRRALSRPRHGLSAGARRRAEAQGAELHPRRRLCGGRAEARADRARSTRTCRWS